MELRVSHCYTDCRNAPTVQDIKALSFEDSTCWEIIRGTMQLFHAHALRCITLWRLPRRRMYTCLFNEWQTVYEMNLCWQHTSQIMVQADTYIVFRCMCRYWTCTCTYRMRLFETCKATNDASDSVPCSQAIHTLLVCYCSGIKVLT